MLHKTTDTIRVTGVGNKKEHAISGAFGSIQKQVLGEHADKILVRIEPLEVNVIEAKRNVFTERFFFFFFPREKAKYEVTLDVKVELGYMLQGEIKFEEVARQAGTIDKLTSRG